MNFEHSVSKPSYETWRLDDDSDHLLIIFIGICQYLCLIFPLFSSGKEVSPNHAKAIMTIGLLLLKVEASSCLNVGTHWEENHVGGPVGRSNAVTQRLRWQPSFLLSSSERLPKMRQFDFMKHKSHHDWLSLDAN